MSCINWSVCFCSEFLTYTFFPWTFTELYEDEPNLEQYSPFLGENFIDYPILEEYGVPTVEEFPDEGPEEDDGDDDQNEENDSTETEQKDKKEEIKHKGTVWEKLFRSKGKVFSKNSVKYIIFLRPPSSL